MAVLRPDRREYTSFPVPNLSTWSVALVRSALAQHDVGNFEASAILCEQLERNPRIHAALNTRVLGCLGAPFTLEPGDGDKRRNEAVRARIAELWPEMVPFDATNELLRWTVLMGVGLAEKVWRQVGGLWVPTIKPWHPCFLYWHQSEHRYYVTTMEGFIPIDPGDPHWLVFKSTRNRPWMRGVVRCLGLQDSIRSFAVRDWARYSEVHGLPIRKAHVPATSKQDDKDKFVSSVANLTSESTVLLPRDRRGENEFDLDLLEPKDQAWEAFKQLIGAMDADVAIAIQGQNLTTEHAKAGGYAAAKVGDQVRGEYKAADADMLAITLREGMLKDFVAFNYGESARDCASRPCWNTKPEADLSTKATTLQALGTALISINQAIAPSGKQIDAEEIAEQFDLPLTDAPPPAPAPAAPEPPAPDDGAPGPTEPMEQPPKQPGPAAMVKSDALDASARLQSNAGINPRATGSARNAVPPSNGNGGVASESSAAAALAAGSPAPTAALAAGQVWVDDVADRATLAAPTALDGVLAPVLAALAASTDYDDLRKRLLAAFPDMSVTRLRELAAGAIAMAEACGLWSGAAEASPTRAPGAE